MTQLEIVQAFADCPIAASPRVATLLSLADAQTSTAYGARRDEAVALLVLHWLALADRDPGGAPGPITSQSEGDLTVAYGQVPNVTGAPDLQTTNYGLRLLGLRRKCFIGARNRRILCP